MDFDVIKDNTAHPDIPLVARLSHIFRVTGVPFSRKVQYYTVHAAAAAVEFFLPLSTFNRLVFSAKILFVGERGR